MVRRRGKNIRFRVNLAAGIGDGEVIAGGINKSWYGSNLSQTPDEVVDPLGALQGPRVGASADEKLIARQMRERPRGVAVLGVNPVDDGGELQQKGQSP